MTNRHEVRCASTLAFAASLFAAVAALLIADGFHSATVEFPVWDIAWSAHHADAELPDPAVEAIERYFFWRAPETISAELRRPVALAVVEEARRHGLDPYYVLAVMKVESDFYPDAVSNRGAKGLMQLTPVTIREVLRRSRLPVGDDAEPVAVRDVRLGVRYLAYLEKRYRSRDNALAAWNAGPSALARAMREEGSVPKRWLAFAKRVNKEYRRLQDVMDELEAPVLAYVGSYGVSNAAQD